MHKRSRKTNDTSPSVCSLCCITFMSAKVSSQTVFGYNTYYLIPAKITQKGYQQGQQVTITSMLRNKINRSQNIHYGIDCANAQVRSTSRQCFHTFALYPLRFGLICNKTVCKCNFDCTYLHSVLRSYLFTKILNTNDIKEGQLRLPLILTTDPYYSENSRKGRNNVKLLAPLFFAHDVTGL